MMRSRVTGVHSARPQGGTGLQDVRRPVLGKHEVLGHVRAVSVNWADATLTRGDPS
jgi:NADPH:quinone reductase-like Zn-dependent oxidoreductase